MLARETDSAQICMNGHVVNDLFSLRKDRNRPRCETCGEATIIHCTTCKRRILGTSYIPSGSGGLVDSKAFERPAYCYSCGVEHPWTTKSKQVALELFLETSEEKPTKEEGEQFQQALDEIAKNSPEASLATVRLKKQLMKAGKPAGEMLKNIISGLTTEAIKISLFGPGA